MWITSYATAVKSCKRFGFALLWFVVVLTLLPVANVSAAAVITIDSHSEGQEVAVGIERISGSFEGAYQIELVINGRKIVKAHMVDPDGDNAGTWYYDLDTSEYDGEIELAVKGQDAATRYHIWSQPLNIYVDHPPANVPSVTITYPLDGSSVCGIALISVDVEAKNPLSSVEIRINGGAWEPATRHGTAYMYMWNTSGIGDKTSSIEARATDSYGNTGRSLTTYVKVGQGTNEPIPVMKQDRAMWIWERASYNLILNPGSRTVLDEMAKDTETFGQDPITTFYLGVDKYYGIDMLEDEREKVQDFVKWAHHHGYQVHALIAGGTVPPYLGAYDRYEELAIREFEKVINYNIASQPDERFDGVNVDTEPYILPDFQTDYPSVQIQYLKYFEKLMNRRDTAGYGLLVGPAIPRWYDTSTYAENITWRGESKWLSEHIQDMADYISIMNYRDTAEGSAGIIAQAQGEIDYANLIGKPNSVIIGVETKDIANSGDPETITFREEGRSYMEAELDKVYAAFDDNPAFGGIAMHHYDDIRALPSVWGPLATYWLPSADTTPPSALSEDPTAIALDYQSIELNYGRASDNMEVEYYVVYRSTDSGFTADDSHIAGTSRGWSYTDIGLLPNTTYYYKIAAVDVHGNIGPVSVETFATTEATTLRPLMIRNMEVDYDGSKGTVTLQVVDMETEQGIQAEVHGRFTHMGGTFVITNTDESGFMTADSESVVEYSGEIGFEPRMITADGYYWAQAYDEPHTASTQWFKKTYSVVEDTYVRGGSYMDVNYGLETKLEVKDAPGNSDYDRLAFMKFHLDDVELAAVQQVHLYFHVPAGVTDEAVSYVPITIKGLTSDDWSEETATWQQRPSMSGSIVVGTASITEAGWYSIDVTDYVKSQVDPTVTFRFSDESVADRLVRIDSKESDFASYLLVE